MEMDSTMTLKVVRGRVAACRGDQQACSSEVQHARLCGLNFGGFKECFPGPRMICADFSSYRLE